VVVRKGTNTLGGLVISVIGPGGQVHYYAHLERYGDFKALDWVKQGDIIGYVGNTGNAATTPPHLHYGIYTASGAIDPYPLLVAPGAKPGKSVGLGEKTTSLKKRPQIFD
jgi:peptidoglycan LD-endopeptidase LytH